MRKSRGFTLVELLVTIAVLAIIAVMAAPAINKLLLKQNLNKSSQELITVLSQARAKAAFERKEVAVHLNTANVADKDLALKDTTSTDFTTLNWAPSGKAILKSGSPTSIIFLSTGLVKNTTVDTSFIVCEQSSGTLSKTIIISKMGTIQQIAEGTCS